MLRSSHGGSNWLLRALVTFLAGLVVAAGYVAGLVATHVSVACLSVLLHRRAIRPPFGKGSDALLVGTLTGFFWVVLIAAGAAVVTNTTAVFGRALVLSSPVGLLVGWQVATWREGAYWAQIPSSLTLGSWRRLPFFVRHLFVVTAPRRVQHLAVSGATGSGKTTLIQNMLAADVRHGAGLCVIDPKDHNLISGILAHIPPRREKDVILLDATDTNWPIGFNPLCGVPPDRYTLATAELLAIFHRYFASSWGTRLEHLLRHTLLALLETPEATLLDIPRFLLDAPFRQWALEHTTNQAVYRFFTGEYEQIVRRRGEAIEPILNKVGALLAYPELRNILGQTTSSFDVSDVMNQGKLLFVHIPQGTLGEDVSSFLGALVVATIQLAAHRRVALPSDRRRLFYCYVDEFQNFATSSFAKILSEARGFNLGLVCVNQFAEQLSEELQQAIEHNVATMIECRSQSGRYQLQVSRIEDRLAKRPPLILTPPPPLPAGDPAGRERIRAMSRARYGRPRAEVEREIQERLSRGSGGALAMTGRAAPRFVDVDEE